MGAILDKAGKLAWTPSGKWGELGTPGEEPNFGTVERHQLPKGLYQYNALGVWSILIWLNDELRWSFVQIADWLESIGL